MTTKLKIEKILSNVGHGQYLLVRPVVPGQKLKLAEKNFLDNVELENHLDIPRKISEEGEQDLDFYSIKIKNDHEVYRLRENTIAELIPGDLPCLPPWHFVDKGFNSQLEKEISGGHILFGKDVKTIAMRQDNDNLLFAVFHSDFKYVEVHLNWSQSRNPDSRFPTTITYRDWSDVYNNLFVPDNKDWD